MTNPVLIAAFSRSPPSLFSVEGVGALLVVDEWFDLLRRCCVSFSTVMCGRFGAVTGMFVGFVCLVIGVLLFSFVCFQFVPLCFGERHEPICPKRDPGGRKGGKHPISTSRLAPLLGLFC